MSAPRKPRVFISRTTAGLAAVAEEIKTILETRIEHPCDIIIQSGFVPDWRTVPQMLQQRLGESDAVIALIGPAHGGEPDYAPAKISDNIPADRKFSYTQWEYLVARELKRPIFTFLVSGPGIVAPYVENDADGKPLPPAEAAQRAERQQQFIADFPMQQRELRHTYTDRALLLDHIAKLDIPLTAHAGKPSNIPYTSLGTLFKGRDTFLAELRQHLTAESTGAITGKRTIHGMGGVGKTRAAIEYAWKHADDYNALLFITGDTPEALHRNIAALCGPLVLNLPEQDERDQSLQVEAALKWLKLHPGWFLIIDNVDTEQAADETKALLAKLTTGHVLITSRIGDWTGHVKSLDLDVLSDTASIEFLDERTAERRPKRDDDQKNVAALVQLLDCLALALEQAGAHISTSAISYADYIALWESKRPAALAWHDQEKMKYPRSLAITYETSVAQLRSGAKDLFNILAWFAPDPIPRNLLDSRPNPADERHNLSDIERLSLARYLSDGKTFTIHRLIQEITRAQQEKAITPAIPTEPPAKPQGLFARFFGKKEQPQKAQQPIEKPTALLAALEWINGEYIGEPADVRSWPVLIPLTPHAIAAANAGVKCDIRDPSGRLLNQCAILLATRADHHGAEPLYRKTLAIAEKALGKTHPEVAICLNNLASLLQATNRHAEAEPLMRRALAIDEASFGDSHPNVAIRLNNLAQLLQDTNRLGEAEPLMRRALAIDLASFGDSHPKVARGLNNLASLLKATNRLGEADPLMRRALAINEASYGDSHPEVAINLSSLATLLYATNRLGEAEPLMRRALAIDEASYGDSHPKVALRLNNLALLLQATNRLGEAEPLMRRALAIDEASYGDSHPDVATDLSSLATLLYATNRLGEAEPLMRRHLEIFLNFTSDTGHQHPHLIAAIDNYASLLMEMGDTPAQVREKISALMKTYGVSV